MNKIIALTLLLTWLVLTHPAPAHAANGHESNCLVTNVGYDVGEMHLICGSGSINYAFLTGASSNSIMPSGTCPTLDIDSLKMMHSIALAARVSGLFLSVYYVDSCTGGTIPIRAIISLELKGN